MRQLVFTSIMVVATVMIILFNTQTVSATGVEMPRTVQPAPSDRPAPPPASRPADPAKPDDQTQTMTCDPIQCQEQCAALGFCDIGCDIHDVCRCDTSGPC